MPRIPKSPIAIGFALYKAWKKLPPAQREKVLKAAQEHGPRVARAAAQTAKRVRPR